MNYHVFISYRRDGGDAMARLLYDRLKAEGYEPFYDAEQMRRGKFNKQLLDRIAECEDFLLILSPNALKRCRAKDDWVRQEIQEALRLKKNIVPFILRKFSEPQNPPAFLKGLLPGLFIPEDVLDSLKNQGVAASQEHFDSTIEKLKRLLSYKPGQEEKAAPLSIPSLPSRISLFELLGIENIDEFPIERKWAQADATRSLAVPIGVTRDGTPVYLDLHQKKDGPHGLIAGPAGSGKTEFLYTFFLTLALHFSPEHVQLLLIDDRDRKRLQELKKLPHTGLCIPDSLLESDRLSEETLEKFLVSLALENERRKSLLARYGAANINQYQKKRAQDAAMPPMPHMVIGIDDWSLLKRCYPHWAFQLQQFGEQEWAQTYGYHLLFCLQDPAGSCDDKLYKTTNFKICSTGVMRCYGEEEVASSDPVCPGRLCLQTPSHLSIRLLQLAYSGNPAADFEHENAGYKWFFENHSQQQSIIQALRRSCLD